MVMSLTCSWRALTAVGVALLTTHCAVSFKDYPVGDPGASAQGGASTGGVAGGSGTGGTAGSGGAGGVSGGGGSGGSGGSATGGTGGTATGGTGGTATGGTGGTATGGTGGAGGFDAGATGGTGGAGGLDAGAGGSGGTDASVCSGPVVVNEVVTDGPSGGSDEYVELYNAGSCTVSLAGWSLHYASAGVTSGSGVVYWTGMSSDQLSAGGYFVLAGSGFAGTRNGSLTSGLALTAGGVGIYDNHNTLMDSMAWGSVSAGYPFVEGTTCAAPASGFSASRIPDGKDTNDNSMDFTVPAQRTPGAQNVQ